MDKKNIINAILSFALTLFMLSAAVFAWFTLSEISNIEQFIVEVNDFDAEIILQVKKNNGEFISVSTKSEMDAMFRNTIPNDTYTFRLKIRNTSTTSANTSIYLFNITNTNGYEGYDMRDVFYLVDGTITVNGVSRVVDVIDKDTNYEVHNQILNLYRFNNIINSNNNLYLFNTTNLAVNEEIVIMFAISYDKNTSDEKYQAGSININSINVNMN